MNTLYELMGQGKEVTLYLLYFTSSLVVVFLVLQSPRLVVDIYEVTHYHQEHTSIHLTHVYALWIPRGGG